MQLHRKEYRIHNSKIKQNLELLSFLRYLKQMFLI